MSSVTRMKDAVKSARIEIRTSAEVKEELERAASMSGVTLTAFIVNLARTEARRIAADAERIKLNREAWDRLTEIIDNPPAPNAALKDLMKT
ncbi:DUF1778 domain-containing protein [Pseudidiomarina aestuarii]|uniref:type II toxin-antitoxin system TacA family antitoxin n=1 Tax=Pseudidiomarina aestuarii TaxID=624146 RepID=UPI003A96E84B